MSDQNVAAVQDYIPFNEELERLEAHKTSDFLFDKPLTHNELIVSALKAMQHGEFKLFDVVGFSCSFFENPIQMICRHKESGRVKIANIDRSNCSLSWENDSLPWN